MSGSECDQTDRNNCSRIPAMGRCVSRPLVSRLLYNWPFVFLFRHVLRWSSGQSYRAAFCSVSPAKYRAGQGSPMSANVHCYVLFAGIDAWARQLGKVSPANGSVDLVIASYCPLIAACLSTTERHCLLGKRAAG